MEVEKTKEPAVLRGEIEMVSCSGAFLEQRDCSGRTQV
jgi:hypothetical protein